MASSSGYSGCGLGGGPHWRRGLWGAHLSPRGQQCGQVSALGGSGPHCAPLGLETWLEKLQGISLEEESSLPFCSAYCSCVFPRLASGPVGLAWDLPQLCCSCASKCRGTRAMCFNAKGRKRRSRGWLSSDGLLPVCLSAH